MSFFALFFVPLISLVLELIIFNSTAFYFFLVLETNLIESYLKFVVHNNIKETYYLHVWVYGDYIKS